ncbi:M28 family metallopeptidase [Nafulsella turpanensis]|uniref:M28 family metallopeptidase n=1 Tax=Nafulsella turpanensis TaxID=1265690 RepID=UPI0003691AF6|nr:M20/M25/M40 family metallo-hydrolase [Nafulsella turpanensis]
MPANLVYGVFPFIFLLFFFLPFQQKPSSQQQVLPYARKVVDTLSAPSMHGRGYVADGHLKAANFIASEFQRLGLQSFGNGFFQEFEVSVNTFPTEVEVIHKGQSLKAGREFLVGPCSQTIHGTFPLLSLSKKEILDASLLLRKLQTASGKILVIDQTLFAQATPEEKQKLQETMEFLKHFKNNPATAITFLTTDKLSWHVAQQPCETPQLIIKKGVLPGQADSLELHIENKHLNKLNTQNVIGLVKGKNPEKGVIAYSAHYDHLGRMGENTYFPGANDNASGVAMLLSLARHYAKPENKPEQDMLFMAFGAEELGLLGSKHFVENPLLPLEEIDFLLNLDITGTGDEGIKVVNGTVFEEQFQRLQALNEEHQLLPKVSARGEACNSDHCLFYEAGVPSFFIYTLGGIQAYHDIDDKAATLPLTEFEDLFTLLTLFTKSPAQQ